jgi:hypothetical protein
MARFLSQALRPLRGSLRGFWRVALLCRNQSGPGSSTGCDDRAAVAVELRQDSDVLAVLGDQAQDALDGPVHLR